MKISVLYGLVIVVSLIGGSGAWAQNATATNDSEGPSASRVPAATSDASANATPSQSKDTSASATPRTIPVDPNADKPPMQARELANLVPKDSSQPPIVSIDRVHSNSLYRYDKAGVNCSLYPTRCRGQSY